MSTRSHSKVLIVLLVVVVLVCCIGYVPYGESQPEDGNEVPISEFTDLSRSHRKLHSRRRGRGSRRRDHTSLSAINTEITTYEDSELPKPWPKLPSMPELMTAFQKGKYPPLKDYNLSDDEVAMVAQLFNIKGLDSSVSLQREFLGCPAKNLIRDTRIREFVDGRYILTKQYQTCKELSFKKQRGVVGLISFPGSGNSWVRQLLETSTGVFTGSVYCDKSYVQAGMVGEGVRSEFVVAVKCHSCHKRAFERFSKLIYVIRSPFDAILSEFTRKAVHIGGTYTNASSKHVAELRSTGLSEVSDKWQEKVIQMKNGWLHHITTCLQSEAKLPMLVVKYENLKSNLFMELKRMLDFLEIPYTDDDIECTVNSNVENFHRQHHDKSFDPYSPQQKQSILDIIREANVILNQFDVNYDTD